MFANDIHLYSDLSGLRRSDLHIQSNEILPFFDLPNEPIAMISLPNEEKKVIEKKLSNDARAARNISLRIGLFMNYKFVFQIIT